MLEEFKKFIARGNVVDLAIGIIVGGAFGKVVSSLVNDIVMPPLGLLLGKVDFSDLYINLSRTHYATFEKAQAAGAPTINYGAFLGNVVDFFIISICIFLVIRQVNRFHRQKPETHRPVEPETKSCPYCMSNIPSAATRCPNCTSHLIYIRS